MIKDSLWWVKYFLDFSILRNLQTILKTGRHFVLISMIIKLSSVLFEKSTVLKSKKDCEKVSQRLSSYRFPMHKLWRVVNNRKRGVSFVSKSKFMLMKWCCVSQTIWCKLYIFNLPHVCVCVARCKSQSYVFYSNASCYRRMNIHLWRERSAVVGRVLELPAFVPIIVIFVGRVGFSLGSIQDRLGMLYQATQATPYMGLTNALARCEVPLIVFFLS